MAVSLESVRKALNKDEIKQDIDKKDSRGISVDAVRGAISGKYDFSSRNESKPDNAKIIPISVGDGVEEKEQSPNFFEHAIETFTQGIKRGTDLFSGAWQAIGDKVQELRTPTLLDTISGKGQDVVDTISGKGQDVVETLLWFINPSAAAVRQNQTMTQEDLEKLKPGNVVEGAKYVGTKLAEGVVQVPRSLTNINRLLQESLERQEQVSPYAQLTGMPLELVSRFAPSEEEYKKTLGAYDKTMERINAVVDQNQVSGPAKFIGDVVGSMPQMALNFIPGIGPVLFGASAAGGYAQQAEQQGATVEQQLLYGLAGGAAEMALNEVLGIIPGMKSIMSGEAAATGNLWKQILKNAVSEAVEEGAIDPVMGFAEKYLYNPDKAIVGTGGVIDFGQMGYDAAAGAAMSLLFSALGLPASYRARKLAEQYVVSGKELSSSELNTLAQQYRQDVNTYALEQQIQDEITTPQPEMSEQIAEELRQKTAPKPQKSQIEIYDEQIGRQQAVVEDLEYQKNYLELDVNEELATETDKLNRLIAEKQAFIEGVEREKREAERAYRFEQGDIPLSEIMAEAEITTTDTTQPIKTDEGIKTPTETRQPASETQPASVESVPEQVNIPLTPKMDSTPSQEVKAEEKPVKKKPTDIQTGKPFDATVYRGEGKSASEIYNYIKYPAAGKGKYYAFSEKQAKKYGDKIITQDIKLDNPYVIHDDADWIRLTKASGWEFPNQYGMDEKKAIKNIDALKEYVTSSGYDGIVVDFEDYISGDINRVTRNAIKTIRNVFGHDQVVVYDKTKPKPETQRLANAVTGKDGVAMDNEGNKISFSYKVVNVDDLIASHTTSLNENPDYPQELQPRDRGRVASSIQIDNIINNLQPEFLGENVKISDGAPIIGSDGIVESGNGRVIALKKMYDTGHENVKKYTDWLKDNAETYGIDVENLPKNPVLVRERTTDVDRVAFAKKANESSVAQMSASETARSDAEKMTGRTLALFVPNDDGIINTAANRQFISSFIGEVIPQNEQGRYITDEGALSQEGLTRIKNAIFYKAYGHSRMMAKFSEALDNNIKNVTNAMLALAPRFVSISERIKNGSLHNLDFSSDLATAAELFMSLKESGQDIEMYRKQVGLFESDVSDMAKDILVILNDYNRSARKIIDFFNKLLDDIEKLGDPKQINLFGKVESYNKADVLDAVIRRHKDEGPEKQVSIFQVESGEGGKDYEDTGGQGRGRAETKRTKTEQDITGSSKKRADDEVKGYSTKEFTGKDTSAMPRGDDSSTTSKTVDDLIALIEKHTGVPIRTGKYKQKALGIFKIKPEVIRSKVRGDMPVISHELGHYFDKLYKFSDSKEFDTELMKLGERTSRDSYSKEQVRAEGIAEFVRLYLTDPNNANAKAPDFLEAFEKAIDNDTLKFLSQLRTDITTIVNLPNNKRIYNDVSDYETRKSANKSVNILQKVYDMLINEKGPFERIQRIAEEKGWKGKDIDILTQNYSGFEAKALEMLFDKQRDLDGNVIGDSMEEMLRPISRKEVKKRNGDPIQERKDFISYMISRRAMDYRDRNLVMPQPWYVYEDNIQAMENKYPYFVDVFNGIREWEDNNLNLLVESGIKSEDEVDKIRFANANHVPLYRIREAAEAIRAGSGNTLGQSKDVVKRAKGSGATIIDPLESIIVDSFILRRAAEANNILGVLYDMAGKVDGIGSMVEKVPPGGTKTSFTVDEVKKQLKAIAQANKDTSLEKAVDNMTDEELESVMSIYRPLFRERDNEVTVYRNGKKKLLQVDPELYKAIKGLNREQGNIVIRILNVPKKVLQAGAVTTVNFIMRNMSRDTFTSLIQSEAGINPVDIFKGYVESWRKGKWQKEMTAAGGASEFININDRSQAQMLEDDLLGFTMKDKLIRLADAISELKANNNERTRGKVINSLKLLAGTPFQKIREGIKFSEEGPRVAEYKKAVEKGVDKAIAASWARKLSVDFLRHGYTAKEVNKITAFFNANIQGIVRMAETFAKHPARTMLRGFLYITLPTLALYFFNHDDEDYQQLPEWRKALFFNIPVGGGKFLMVPKPYGYGFIFGSLPEIALNKILHDDPETWNNIKESFDKHFSIPVAPSAVKPAVDVYANKQWTGSPIDNVADQKKPAWLRQDDKTSLLASIIGNALKNEKGISPKQIDYLIKQHTGDVGEFFWRLPDTIIKGMEVPTDVTQYPIIKGFIIDSAFSSDAINKLYDYGEELDKRYQAFKETGEYKAISHMSMDKQKKVFADLEVARERYNELAELFSDARKRIKEINADDSLSAAVKRGRVRQVYVEMNKYAKQFNDAYARFKKEQGVK